MKFHFITKVIIFIFFLHFFDSIQIDKNDRFIKNLVQCNNIKYELRGNSPIAFIFNSNIEKRRFLSRENGTSSIKKKYKIYRQEVLKTEESVRIEKKKSETEEIKRELCSVKRYNVLNRKNNQILNSIFKKNRNQKYCYFKFFSPAKVNFFLRLKEKKEYHNELSTLMHSINLGDDIYIKALDSDKQNELNKFFKPCSTGDFLTIEKEKDKCITKEKIENEEIEREDADADEDVCVDENNLDIYNNYPLNEKNIIIKVLKEFRKQFQIEDGVKFLIHIKKRIPIFSGLGGGSSNGATIFYFLKKYFYAHVKFDKMKENLILENIGSDISFFSSSGFAYCTGKGNDVIDLKEYYPSILKSGRIYLFHINEGLSSQSVYKNVNYKNIIQYNPISLLKKIINCDSSNDNTIKIIEEKEKQYMKNFVNFNDVKLQNLIINDLELPAFFLKEKLKFLKKFLFNQNIFKAVSMSGSGTTIFAFPKKDIKNCKTEKREIKQLINKLKDQLHLRVKVHICEFLRKKGDVWFKPNGISTLIE